MALPPPVIQIRPPAFLGLLGLQNGGKSPENLAPYAQPTFELSDWYLRAAQINATLVSVAIGAGTVNGFASTGYTCPQDEWWWVSNFSAQIQTGAGDTVGACALGMSFQSSSLILSVEHAPVTGANGSGWLRAHDQAFWVPPGAALGLMQSTNVVALAPVVVYRGILARLKV